MPTLNPGRTKSHFPLRVGYTVHMSSKKRLWLDANYYERDSRNPASISDNVVKFSFIVTRP